MNTSSFPVILIAFGEYNNLGMGYLSSVLSEEGFRTELIDFQLGGDAILSILKRKEPLIVGFSVIFEHYIDEFRKLIRYLRKSGIKCHFTAGGQYATIRYDELLRSAPQLDSIVRFEGEYTFPELVRCINEGKDWRNIKSLAFNEKGRIITTPLLPIEKDLDKFPFPFRSPLKEYAFGRKFTTILAGRGCIHRCTYCNAGEFYRQSSGPIKRIRKPELVAGEMDWLFHKNDCSIFIFQDDDFPVKTENGNKWISDFCRALEHKNLNDKIMWKINCRPDEIDEEDYAMMKNHGLFLVFVGLEDGTDAGLRKLNKKITVTESLSCIEILKRLGLAFDYGFMLFQPSTIFSSLRENIDFLRKICSDGYTSVTYMKLMPYYETRIERELMEQGRLKGRPGYLDYDFNEKSFNQYYDFINRSFMEWQRAADGLVNISKWTRNYFEVYYHFSDQGALKKPLYEKFRSVVSDSNHFILDTLDETATLFEYGKFQGNKKNTLAKLRSEIDRQHDHFRGEVRQCINDLSRFAYV